MAVTAKPVIAVLSRDREGAVNLTGGLRAKTKERLSERRS